jgi:gliding motility-associated-like protein
VAVGTNDNVFVCGEFDRELDLKGIKLESDSPTAGYIAKLDSSGNTLWAKTFGAFFSEIARDPFGDIYTVGNFQDTLYVENDTIVNAMTFGGVLVKYNDEGDLLWYKYFADRPASSVKTDTDGNVYVLGLDYSHSPSGLGTWVAKFDTHGGQVFYTDISTTNDFLGARISIGPEESVYVSGLAAGHAMIGDISYSGNASGSFVLVKCTPIGATEWVKTVEDAPQGGSWYTATVVSDGLGNIYYHTHRDMLSLTKFDSDGNLLWAKRNKNISFGIDAMSIDEQGDLVTTGIFRGKFTLGKAKFDSNQQGVFVAKFDSNGECQWTLQGSDQTNDYALSLARSPKTGALFIGGILNSSSTKFGEISLAGPIYQIRAFVLKVSAKSTPIQLDLGHDLTICEGRSIDIHVSGFAKYEWSTNATDSTVHITEPGLYILRAYDKAGLLHVDSVYVDRCFEAFIPNVITPDGDPDNEYFAIEALDVTKMNTLVIFDRWGKKVYSSFAYQNNWNGSDLASGIYYYELINGSDGKSYNGWIHVIR